MKIECEQYSGDSNIKVKKTYIKKCEKCEKEFETINPIKKFCSKECASRKKERYTKTCLICNIEFITPRAEQIYCGTECRIISQGTKLNKQRRRVIKKCELCSKEFESHEYEKRRFCSTKCAGKSPTRPKQEKNRFNNICINCGGEFEVHNYRRDAKFCSTKCHDNFRREVVTCPGCRKDFSVPKWEHRKYCSPECHHKHNTTNVISKTSQIIKEILDERKINNSHEHCLFDNKRKYFIDFWLTDLNVGIEFYGDYWHCNPDVYAPDYYNSKVKLSAEDIWKKDEERIAYIEENYKCDILIIWESETKNLSKLKRKIYAFYKNKKNKKN